MVLVVVVLGSVLAVAVVGALSRPAASDASFAFASVSPGDATANLTLRNGEPIALSSLKVFLGRNGSVPAPTSAWTGPGGAFLSAGQSLAVALQPAAAPDETIRLILVRADVNAMVADVTSQAAGDASPYPPASLAASISPAVLPADGVSSSLVTARVAAPAGALTVASVRVDLANLTAAAGQPPASLALNDLGLDGDAQGGDGVWSGSLRASVATVPGTYNLTLNATDAAGGATATGVLVVTVTPGPTCAGCPATGTQTIYEGARFYAPTSANATALRLRNFSWDQLNPSNLASDQVELRVQSSGRTWIATLELDYQGITPVAKTLTLTTNGAQTIYKPRNATLPLAGLDLDLLNPIGSQQWVYSSGSLDPLARYANAGLAGTPILVVTTVHDMGKGQSLTAIYSADVVIR